MVAHDQPPFVRHYHYSSPEAIDPTVAIVFDPKRGKVRSLTPLLVWHRERSSDERSCYVLDMIDGCKYKPCHMTDEVFGGVIARGLPRALKRLADEGRFVVGEVDIRVADLLSSEAGAGD